MLTKMIRLNLTKPVSSDWPEATARLGAYRSVMAWALTEAVTAARVHDAQLAAGLPPDEPSLGRAARSAIDQVVRSLKERAAAKLIDLERDREKARAKREAATDPEHRSQVERSVQNLDRRILEEREKAQLDPSQSDTWSYVATQKYIAWRKQRPFERGALPTYQYGHPILVRNRAWELRRTEKGGFELSFRLRSAHQAPIRSAHHGHEVWVATPAGPQDWVWAERIQSAAGVAELLEEARAAAAQVEAEWAKAEGERRDELARELEELRGSVAKLEASYVKPGDIKIAFDEKHRSWWVAIAVGFEPPPRDPSDRVLAIHRGIVNLLVAASSRGEGREDAHTEILEEGGKMLATKRGFAARRAQVRSATKDAGSGHRGHGVKRRFRNYRSLEDKERDWVRTYCQQLGAKVVRIARARQCGIVAIEDWNTIWSSDRPELEPLLRSFPFAQLKDAITWACTKAGLHVVQVPSSYQSQTCPKCGHVSADNVSSRTFPDGKRVWSFHCGECQLDRPSDYVAAWNMLIRMGKTPGIEEHAKERKQTRQRVAKPKKTSKQEVQP